MFPPGCIDDVLQSKFVQLSQIEKSTVVVVASSLLFCGHLWTMPAWSHGLHDTHLLENTP